MEQDLSEPYSPSNGSLYSYKNTKCKSDKNFQIVIINTRIFYNVRDLEGMECFLAKCLSLFFYNRMRQKRVKTLKVRRGIAQSGSASALGAEGRGFESLCPDHS